MKIQDWTKLLLSAAFAVALASCEHPPKTGTGPAVDDMGTTGDQPGIEKPMPGEAKEDPRITTKDGFQWDKWEPILFGFDSVSIRANDRPVLEQIAKWLKENPSDKIQIAGNCDERGTEEYNLSLGQRRAAAARNYLIQLGVDGARIATVSYGEGKPADAGHNEDAWTKNRRDEFGLAK